MNRYRVFYPDPPWAFRVWDKATGAGRSATQHYPTQSLDYLKRLDIEAHAEKDAVMLMWSVWPSLPDAIALAAAWGFTYKTVGFLWVKTTRRAVGRFCEVTDPANFHFGLGYYTRANTEPCLLFTRGKGLKRLARDVRQLVVAPVARHSEKPLIHDRISRLFPGPYVELFARRDPGLPGWSAWGNEIQSTAEFSFKGVTLAD